MIKESNLDPARAHLRQVVKAGDYWLQRVNAGQTLRIVDLEGNQAADTLFYCADRPEERYSAMDTVRSQGNVYLSAGSRLLSNFGNPMLRIPADTCGRHDTLGGACATESNTVRYALEKRCLADVTPANVLPRRLQHRDICVRVNTNLASYVQRFLDDLSR